MSSSISPPMNLTPQDQLSLLVKMVLIRRFEEKAAEYYGKEKIRGFLHLYNGEEAVATGVLHWRQPQDRIISTYREHGHALAAGLEPKRIMAELFGKAAGCSGGRGGSMHLFDISKNFFGGNAIVGGHLPIAVGMAFADQQLKRRQITFCFLGEGAVAEGVFHESMNLAGSWKVPVLFILENNLYAMGTHISRTLAHTDFQLKAKSYAIDYLETDGMDLPKVLETSERAVNQVRLTLHPFLLVMNTYRFKAHSMFDAELYRSKTEVEDWRKKDPMHSFSAYLKTAGILSEEKWKAIIDLTDQQVEEAVDFAASAPEEPAEDLEKHLTESGK